MELIKRYKTIILTTSFLSNIKLRFKLIIAFLVIGIIPIIIIGYFSYNNAVKTILDNSEKHILNIIDKVDKHMSSKIQYINYIALSITTNQYVNEGIGEQLSPLELGRNSRKVESFFRNLIASHQDISDIIIVDINNLKYGTELIFNDTNFLLKETEYYRQAVIGNGGVVWLGLYDSIVRLPVAESTPKVLVAVSLIYDALFDKVRGIVAINMKPHTFQDILNNLYQESDKNITFIVDQNNNIICCSNNKYKLDIEEIVKSIDSTNGSIVKNVSNNNLLITSKVNDLTGWKVINAVPVNELIKSANTIKEATLILILFSLILIFFLAFLISYNITKPISCLVNLMMRATEGDLNVQAQTSRKDELGTLSRNFNKMLDKIRFLINEVYEEKLNLKKAELEALQAQINPHFLYNTLDTVNWMLIEQGQFEISEIVRAIGNLMKYCIRKDNFLVTIQEEINHIENYLLIQKARMEDRLEYNIFLSEEVKYSKIPKLILQPIAENAIVHGFEKRGAIGILKIIADKYQDNIIITIEDNGAGIEQKVLENLVSTGHDVNGAAHTKIGISNIDKRIKLRYGEEYGLFIESELNAGTRVTVKLPL